MRVRPNLERIRQDVYFVDLEFFFDWDSHLHTQNSGKRGAPFGVPRAYFVFLCWLRVRLGLGYRSLQQVSEKALEEVRARLVALRMRPEVAAQIRGPHFTQIRRRLQAMALAPADATRLAQSGPLVIVLDHRGPAAYDPREWTRRVLPRRVSRGWVRLEMRGLEEMGPPHPDAGEVSLS